MDKDAASMPPPAKYALDLLNTRLHARTPFSCGVDALDVYLKTQASQDMRRDVTAVYILREQHSNIVIGYYTISMGGMEASMLPPDVAQRLPRYDSFPVMRIGRLAVDRNQQGLRLGRHLLLDAFERCVGFSEAVGVMGIRVDAKSAELALFYEQFGFRRFADRELSLFIPIGTIRRLLQP